MVKVLTGAQPGVASQAEQEVIAGAPAVQLQEQTPQAGPSSLDDLLSPEGAALAAEMTAEAAPPPSPEVQAQVEREAIQPPRERYTDEGRIDRWQAQEPELSIKDVSPNDGRVTFQERAKKVADDFQSGRVGISVRPTGESLAAYREGGAEALFEAESQRDEGSLINAVNRSGAVTNVQTDTGNVQTEVDPAYLQIGAAVTENMMSDLAFGEGESFLPQQVEEQAEGNLPVVSKAQGNAALGQQIHREYMRRKNQAEGKPVDEYEDLPQEEATTLGDAFKELYAGSMGPEMVKRFVDPATRQAYFQLTAAGADALKKSATARKRMFPKTNIRPQKTPLGQIRGEQRREVKRVTGKVGTPADMKTLEQAARNLNQVPNVVDKQRMRILFATALPALAGREGLNSIGATINNFGADKMAKFEAQEAAALKKGEEYSAVGNMEALQDSIAQSVRAVAMERNGANYFTYTIQAFNGRMAPNQTFFDATSSKAVRFVTRNAVPANATPNSRVEKNLRQMYAMMLVKDADALLPRERELALQGATKQLHAWGTRLQTLLDQSMTDAQAEQIAQAIEQGMPLTDPNFPQVNGLQFDPNVDAELMKMIKSKGEDGPHFIDGLIDFKNYIEKRTKGLPHHSYFNAYMDGKTNGIASNGIQMGSKEVALATGVIRNNKKQLLDDGDIRDQLKKDLLHNIFDNGWDGTIENTAAMNDIARAVFSYRDLNKATTMTFGYGKELSSFKNDIEETVSFFEQLAKEGGSEAAEREWVIDDDFLNYLQERVDTTWAKQKARMSDAQLAELYQNELVEYMLQKEANVTPATSRKYDYSDPDGTRVDVKMVWPGSNEVPMPSKGVEFAKTARADEKPQVIEIWEKVQWPKEFKKGAKIIVRPKGRVNVDQFYDSLVPRKTSNPNLDLSFPITGLTPSPYASQTDSVKKHGLETFGESLSIMDEEMGSREILIETLLDKYNESLAGVLSDEAIDSRALMRSAAVLHAVTNSLFSIKSYTGFDLNLGGEETLGWEGADTSTYTLYNEGKKQKVTAGRYQTEATSAAIRWKKDKDGEMQAEPGGDAYGGSLPGPVQSLDAATVAMTVTGRSWNKLKEASKGNPYIHTIFDAFKVDAMGYDVVLDEVNRNWLKAAMEWSYLEQTFESTKESMNNFWNEIQKQDPNTKVDISLRGPYRMMGYLTDVSASPSGRFPSRLRNKLNNLMQKPKGVDPEVWEDTTFKATLRIMDKLKKAGWNPNDPDNTTVQHVKTFVRALQDELNLGPRMAAMIKHTNAKKKELAKEIHKSGPVYQYYAH